MSAWLCASLPGEFEKKSATAGLTHRSTSRSAKPQMNRLRERGVLPGTRPRIPDVDRREHRQGDRERHVDFLPRVEQELGFRRDDLLASDHHHAIGATSEV